MTVYIIQRHELFRIVDVMSELLEYCGFLAYADAKAFADRQGWQVIT